MFSQKVYTKNSTEGLEYVLINAIRGKTYTANHFKALFLHDFSKQLAEEGFLVSWCFSVVKFNTFFSRLVCQKTNPFQLQNIQHGGQE